ncbi:MAG: hypothetical protein L3J59_09205 [Methylococcaceae bacterium]|nr:hypothetical protein [Methylococcaceae bacterium]
MSINSLQIEPVFCFKHPFFIIMVLSILLVGCDNGENKKDSSTHQTVQKYAKDTTLKGKVSNKKGLIKSGFISATDSKGKIVATSKLENKSSYSIVVPAGTELPIVLAFFPKSNSTEKDKLITAVIYTSIKKYDINDLTTLIAKKAKSLGGYTHPNMSIAADQTVGIPDANKTSTGFKGDPTKQYGGWH